MRLTKPTILTALAVAAGAAIAGAQIERLSLSQMVDKTDGAVLAEIVGSKVFRVDHPIDGPELYYTTLTLEGTSLSDGTPIVVDVTFPGGFIDEENGAHNSEAPSADDTQLGNVIVAFYKWSDNMGGDVAANALYASHGGLFRTVDGPSGTVVLGRGEGYAIDNNIKVSTLRTAVQNLENEISGK